MSDQANEGRSGRPRPQPDAASPGWLKAVRVTFLLVVAAALVSAARAAGEDARDVTWPRWQAIVPGTALLAAMVISGAASWIVLMHGRGASRRLLRAYFVGQLAKYVPGGVAQAVGQVDQSRLAGA